MKAMILAAGGDTRVRPLTNYTRKPMFPILNVPVIELIILKFKANGTGDDVSKTIGINSSIFNLIYRQAQGEQS